jgi:hypothetical protein
MSPRWNLDPPPPLLQVSVPLPPEPGGAGGAHSPAREGVGESQFQRLEKKLSTPSSLWEQSLDVITGSNSRDIKGFFWNEGTILAC